MEKEVKKKSKGSDKFFKIDSKDSKLLSKKVKLVEEDDIIEEFVVSSLFKVDGWGFWGVFVKISKKDKEKEVVVVKKEIEMEVFINKCGLFSGSVDGKCYFRLLGSLVLCLFMLCYVSMI